MTSLFLLSVLAGQGAAPTQKCLPLIQKAVDRYATAKTLQATITTTQTAQGASVATQTTLAYERPSKIALEQKRGGSQAKTVWMVSNGKEFRYSTPDRLMTSDPYLREAVSDGVHPPQTVGQMYSVIAAGLPDRSPILDFLVAFPADLRYVNNQFSTLVYGGRKQIGGREVHAITGVWRESDFKTTTFESATGNFELYIDDNGDIARYVLHQNFGVPARVVNGRPVVADNVEVTTTWDATVAVNATIDPAKFAMRSR